MKAAILVIDMQQDFFREGRLLQNKNNLINNINQLINSARNLNIPIIWIRQEYRDDLSDAPYGMKKTGKKITIENTLGCKILPELKIDSQDYEIIKKRFSAFYKTSLEDILNKLGIDTLIITGINTHACVRMAAIDAYQRDYEVILALDCIDSYDEEHHRISIKYLTEVISQGKSNPEIISFISSPTSP